MLYEQRSYRIKMGGYKKVLEELRTCFTAFEKHGYRWLGPFRVEIGVNPEIMYFNIWESMGQRESVWKAIMEDETLLPHQTRWNEMEEKEGPIIHTITNTVFETISGFPECAPLDTSKEELTVFGEKYAIKD